MKITISQTKNAFTHTSGFAYMCKVFVVIDLCNRNIKVGDKNNNTINGEYTFGHKECCKP